MIKISEFRIKGLHGRTSVAIPIRDNCLILVGVNGLGKTTIANILYCFLSRQWRRLLEYEFEAVAIDFDQQTISIRRDEIEAGMLGLRRRDNLLSRSMPRSVMERLERNPERLEFLQTHRSPDELRDVAHELELPISLIERLVSQLSREQMDLLEERAWRSVDETMRKNIAGRILYLPTFRRIERDLRSIFPQLEEHIRRFNTERMTDGRTSGYLELVEFGMEDVEAQFKSVLVELRESARAQLNTLVGGYLRDVIRGQAQSYDESVISALNDDTITRILNRVEERTLAEYDKQLLREALERLQNSESGPATQHDKYIGHFFAKLVEIHLALSNKEQSIANLVRVCGPYLAGKSLQFDDKSYQLNVQLKGGANLALSDLSSGEKQVVSLFSHLFLSANENEMIVLIDEPELSLSVEWQRMLLPDVLASGRCGLLIAVTHSPFIFDNKLSAYAHDLRDYVGVRE